MTPPTLTVAGRMVVTNSSTQITKDDQPITLAQLTAGEMVEVEGQQQMDNSVLAKSIDVEDGSSPSPSPSPSPDDSSSGTTSGHDSGEGD